VSDIVIVDYGMGNLRSVVNAFKQAVPQADVCVSSDPVVVKSASRVVFPGQGAMPDCMRRLNDTGLADILRQAAREKPFMGICIGLQMLFDQTEEGNTEALGILKGNVRRFSKTMTDATGMRLKIPQMGWNRVHQTVNHPIWHNIGNHAWFYFVHSYYVSIDEQCADCVIGQTDYGIPYVSAVAHDNLFAVQFHPEKSGEIGLQMLYNFAHWKP